MMVNRREFVSGLTLLSSSRRSAADAQREAKIARIGLLGVSSRDASPVFKSLTAATQEGHHGVGRWHWKEHCLS